MEKGNHWISAALFTTSNLLYLHLSQRSCSVQRGNVWSKVACEQTHQMLSFSVSWKPQDEREQKIKNVCIKRSGFNHSSPHYGTPQPRGAGGRRGRVMLFAGARCGDRGRAAPSRRRAPTAFDNSSAKHRRPPPPWGTGGGGEGEVVPAGRQVADSGRALPRAGAASRRGGATPPAPRCPRQAGTPGDPTWE